MNAYEVVTKTGANGKTNLVGQFENRDDAVIAAYVLVNRLCNDGYQNCMGPKSLAVNGCTFLFSKTSRRKNVFVDVIRVCDPE